MGMRLLHGLARRAKRIAAPVAAVIETCRWSRYLSLEVSAEPSVAERGATDHRTSDCACAPIGKRLVYQRTVRDLSRPCVDAKRVVHVVRSNQVVCLAEAEAAVA